MKTNPAGRLFQDSSILVEEAATVKLPDEQADSRCCCALTSIAEHDLEGGKRYLLKHGPGLKRHEVLVGHNFDFSIVCTYKYLPFLFYSPAKTSSGLLLYTVSSPGTEYLLNLGRIPSNCQIGIGIFSDPRIESCTTQPSNPTLSPMTKTLQSRRSDISN